MPAEITSSDTFGQVILLTMQAFGFSSVLEIGSYDGLGSTQVFIEALKQRPSPRMVCLEPNPMRWQSLCLNTIEHSWIKAVCQPSISLASLTPKDFESDVWQSPYNGLPYPRETVHGWWQESQRYLSCVRGGYLESSVEEFDVALIDGDEFTGYDDYRLVKDRVRCIMLDDAFHAYKCHRANRELASDPAWFPAWCNSTVRNGAAIWVRR